MDKLENKSDDLVAMVFKGHPLVAPRIDHGISGVAFIDHAISVVERALSERPESEVLQDCYRALQEKYPGYFSKPLVERSVNEGWEEDKSKITYH